MKPGDLVRCSEACLEELYLIRDPDAEGDDSFITPRGGPFLVINCDLDNLPWVKLITPTGIGWAYNAWLEVVP